MYSALLQVQQLLQQVNALSNRTVMRDSCLAILQQPPAGAAGQELQQALQQLQLDGERLVAPVDGAIALLLR